MNAPVPATPVPVTIRGVDDKEPIRSGAAILAKYGNLHRHVLSQIHR